jgi:hypothetical protein
MDGVRQENKIIPLINDTQEHQVEVQILYPSIVLSDFSLPEGSLPLTKIQ